MAKLRITSHCLQLEVADKESPDGMSLHFYNLPENCTTITDKLYRGRTDVFELTVVSHRVKQIGLNAFGRKRFPASAILQKSHLPKAFGASRRMHLLDATNWKKSHLTKSLTEWIIDSVLQLNVQNTNLSRV